MPSQRPHSRQSSDSHIGNRKKLKNLTVQLGQRHKILEQNKNQNEILKQKEQEIAIEIQCIGCQIKSRRFGLPKFVLKETK